MDTTHFIVVVIFVVTTCLQKNHSVKQCLFKWNKNLKQKRNKAYAKYYCYFGAFETRPLSLISLSKWRDFNEKLEINCSNPPLRSQIDQYIFWSVSILQVEDFWLVTCKLNFCSPNYNRIFIVYLMIELYVCTIIHKFSHVALVRIVCSIKVFTISRITKCEYFKKDKIDSLWCFSECVV